MTVPLLTSACILAFPFSGLYSYGPGNTLIHRLFIIFRSVGLAFLIFVFAVYLLPQIGSQQYFMLPRSSVLSGWIAILVLMMSIRGGRIINPENELVLNAYGLIDTGADECAIPASYVSLLGHDLQSGLDRKIKTGNGVTIAYSHTATLAILDFQGDHVAVVEKALVDFMPNLHVVLLGVKSFLSKFILTIDYLIKHFPSSGHDF